MRAPCCKPLRIIELCVMTLCFSFLFCLRKYHSGDDTVLSHSALILIFTTYVPLTVLLATDITCELLRTPITNVPMILVLAVGAIMCFSSAAVLLATEISHSNEKSHITLNVVGFLSALSWFSFLIFLIDAIILLRFA